jgi:hypothetical protein
VQAQVTNGLLEPGGFAISGYSILAGSTGCAADGLIYQKSASNGSWVVTGRIPPDAGVCADQPRDVELNYDYAFIRGSASLVRSYRKNGSELDWARNRNLMLTGQAQRPGPIAVQKTLAVAPGSAYFNRGTNWDFAGQLVPIDYSSAFSNASQVVFRDGVLLASDGWFEPPSFIKPYVYVPNSSGGFDHVGILGGGGTVLLDFDISGKTIVASGRSVRGSVEQGVSVYVLPQVLLPPPAIANNFDARNLSGFTFTQNSAYALAGNSSNYLLRQTVAARDTAAVLTATDWRDFQSIEADVKPTSFDLPESFNGIAVRYTDNDNYYFAAMRNAATFVLGRKLNGVFTTLAEQDMTRAPFSIHKLRLSISGTSLTAYILGAGGTVLQAEDDGLAGGRAALVTHRARADFDNLHVTPTAPALLLSREFPAWNYGRPLEYLGGNWRVGEGGSDDWGLLQTDTAAGNAFAIAGTPIDDQSIITDAMLKSFGSTNPVAWFGVVARYVDARNYYYLSIRSSNQLQIRKVVNGTVTVLKAVALSVSPEESHRFVFEVRGDELSASVDGTVVARAVDNSLPRGRYGVATYRTSARYALLSASQP